MSQPAPPCAGDFAQLAAWLAQQAEASRRPRLTLVPHLDASTPRRPRQLGSFIRGTWGCIGGPRRDDDVDPIVVERLIYCIPLTAPPSSCELGEAILTLTDRGWSALQIAAQTGCTTRTVQRHRARRRAQVRADLDALTA